MAKVKSSEVKKSKSKAEKSNQVSKKVLKEKKERKDKKEKKETKASKKVPKEPKKPKTGNGEKKTVEKEKERKTVKPVKKNNDVKDAEPLPPPKKRHTTKSPVDTASTSTTASTPTPRKVLFPGDDPSGVASPAVSLASLKALKKEAEDKGLSLESYMQELSNAELEKNLEDHMKQLVVEEKDTKGVSKEDDQDSEHDDDDEEEEETSDESQDNEKVSDQEEMSTAVVPVGKAASESEGSSSSSDSEDEEEGDEDVDGESWDEDETANEVTKLLEVDTKGGKEIADAADKQKALTVPLISSATGTPSATTGSNADFSNANSRTHKAEWDKYSRQCMNRKLFPCSLASHYLKDKTCLFREWLQHGMDWQASLVLSFALPNVWISVETMPILFRNPSYPPNLAGLIPTLVEPFIN